MGARHIVTACDYKIPPQGKARYALDLVRLLKTADLKFPLLLTRSAP